MSDMERTGEPRTEAGRVLLDARWNAAAGYPVPEFRAAILAIETEARRDVLTAVKREVEKLPALGAGGRLIDRAAVLARIDALAEEKK